MSADTDNGPGAVEADFPGVCESCETILWNLSMWKGHQAVDYCDGGPVTSGLPGGVQP